VTTILWYNSTIRIFTLRGNTVAGPTRILSRPNRSNVPAEVVFNPLGTVPTFNDLPRTPAHGDAWILESDGHMQWYNEDEGWVDLGQWRGPPGAASVPQCATIDVATDDQTVFVLPEAPSDVTKLSLYVNGVRYSPTTDFTIGGTVLTWVNSTFSLKTSDCIELSYI